MDNGKEPVELTPEGRPVFDPSPDVDRKDFDTGWCGSVDISRGVCTHTFSCFTMAGSLYNRGLGPRPKW